MASRRSQIAGVRRESRIVRRLSQEERAEAIRFCKAARARVRARYADERARHGAAVAAIRGEKTTATGTCASKLAGARARKGEADRLLSQWREERREVTARAGKRRGVSRAERASESDDAVVREIPPELEPLWLRVKRQIKGSPRMSRAESFLAYAEAHPSEVVFALAEHADRVLEEQLARRGERIANPAPSYEESHWGERGKGRASTMTIPDPSDGPLVELGEVIEIVYRTKKGGDVRRVEYEHAFRKTLPRLVYNRAGKLLLAGGTYRVTERGIVG